MREHISELIIAVLLIIIAFLFINPYWMPAGLMLTVLVIFAVLFGAFVIFIWKEKKGDERETHLRNIAGRTGYLVGSLVLVVGIIFEILQHHMVNTWLIAALIAMIVAKIAGLVWAKRTY